MFDFRADRLAVLARRCFVLALSVAAHAQQRFKTPEEAADALVARRAPATARRSLPCSGQGRQELVSSGDPVQDDEREARNFSRPMTPSTGS